MPAPDGPIVVICGVRSDGTLRALEITDDDFLKMAFAAAAQGLVGTHGYIDSTWQKNPLLFGYSDGVEESVSDTNITAGNHSISTTAVPAGEIHLVKTVSWAYFGTLPTLVYLYLTRGGSSYYFHTSRVIRGEWEGMCVDLVLEEGDVMTFLAIGTTAGDDMYFRFSGVRVDLDQ